MNVESNTPKYVDENQYEETKDVNKRHTETVVGAYNEIRDSVDHKRSSDNDQTDAMDYLSLIQGVQRTRKFTEISNELRQQATGRSNLGSVPRRERLLSQIHQNNEIPGKSDVCNLNLGQNNNETDHDFGEKITNICNPEDTLLDRSKRNKSSDTDNTSENTQLIDLSSARAEKILHQNKYSHQL